MDRREEVENRLLEHCKKYPALQVQDLHKYIYQSAFGCEHLLTDVQTAVEYLHREAMPFGFCGEAAGEEDAEDFLEMLDGKYCRVHLAYLQKGLSVETLGKLFVLSAEHEEAGEAVLAEMLESMLSLAKEGKLPFSYEEVACETEEWKRQGCPACHHSETFRKNYRPAYRVIKKAYAKFLLLFARIDHMLQSGTVTLAIEGGSASGKTTLANLLAKVYDVALFHMDDFFLRPEQRTLQRFAEPGGNVDRERFAEEVLVPLRKGEPVEYRRFDCGTFTLKPSETIFPKRLNIVEGAYSMHPELQDFYDYSVFLDIKPQAQRKRIEKRNTPEMARRFFAEWIPMEQKYFTAMDVKKQCDISIDIMDI